MSNMLGSNDYFALVELNCGQCKYFVITQFVSFHRNLAAALSSPLLCSVSPRGKFQDQQIVQ